MGQRRRRSKKRGYDNDETIGTLNLMLAGGFFYVGWPAHAQCCGDCNGNGEVTINELVTAVNSALAECPACVTKAQIQHRTDQVLGHVRHEIACAGTARTAT